MLRAQELEKLVKEKRKLKIELCHCFVLLRKLKRGCVTFLLLIFVCFYKVLGKVRVES